MTGTGLSDIPWKEGGIYGTVAYMLSLIVAVAVFYLDHLGSALQRAESTLVETVALILTIFYNSQFVTSQLGGADPSTPLTERGICGLLRCLEFFGTEQGMLFAPIYYVIPPIFLLGMGALVVYVTEPSGRVEALLSGSSMAVGYVVMMLLIPLVLRLAAGFKMSLPTIVAVGVLYPVVFGAVGGLVANEVVNLRADSRVAKEKPPR